MVGGGVVEIVTLDNVEWAAPPDRDEAGTPNHVGAIAFATAIQQLEEIGMQAVAEHEAQLTAHALGQLADVPGIIIYGDSDPANASDRLGVIPFNISGIDHFKTAAILGHEFGIGVRNGCFCAHPLILHLVELNEKEVADVQEEILSGTKAKMPGLVRASFGLYNTLDEVDKFVTALKIIADGEYHGEYIQDSASGEYHPKNWQPKFDEYYSLA
ncbi:MAG: aminotransferase class V-fold PLP-dependent enzyme, partial [Chloroflexota bacterium]